MMDIIRKAAEAAIISSVVLVFMIAGTDMASALTWSEVQAKLNSVDPTVLIEYGQNEPHGIIAGANDGPLVVKKGKKAIIELAGPIDRNLASPKENGYVIRIEGECFIKGGRYDSGFNNFIKGGNNTGNGGGIYVAKGGVLILDESTSALDPSTEKQLLDSLHSRYHRQKTILFISHREAVQQYAGHEVRIQ